MSVNRKKIEVVTVPAMSDPFAVLDQDNNEQSVAGIIGAIGRAYQTADGDFMIRVPKEAISTSNVAMNRDKKGQFTGSARIMFTFQPEKPIVIQTDVTDEKTGITRKVTLTRATSFNLTTTCDVKVVR